MRPSKIFSINSADREHFFLGKLARELQKAADPCFRQSSENISTRQKYGQGCHSFFQIFSQVFLISSRFFRFSSRFLKAYLF